MTGRLAAADSVTGAQSPATMISAVILRPHPGLSRASHRDYLSSSTTQSTITASTQQVVARSSPMRGSFPIDVPRCDR
jgi:hypothetical protein